MIYLHASHGMCVTSTFAAEMAAIFKRPLTVLLPLTSIIVILILLYGMDWKSSPVVLHQLAHLPNLASLPNNTPSIAVLSSSVADIAPSSSDNTLKPDSAPPPKDDAFPTEADTPTTKDSKSSSADSAPPSKDDAFPTEADTPTTKEVTPSSADNVPPPKYDASTTEVDTPTTKEVTLSSADSAPPPKDAPTSTNVTVFVENFDGLNEFYGNSFTKMESDIPRACKLPHGGSCILQHSEASAQTANVVFRMVRFIHPEDTVRYHEGQLLAVMNSEAERGEYGLQQLREADIKMDHHPSSEILLSEVCSLPVHKWESLPPSDPTQRKGIAMFTSNCGAEWRLDYLDRLSRVVHIDSYGRCLHNKDEPPAVDKYHNLIEISSKYRMVVTFENIIQDDYISEKIGVVFSSGAIPVYWGPPQVYSWVPGNHSFIDASKYKDSPENLGRYLKRVDEEDDLFKYHTSNFDINKTKEIKERLCPKVGYMCLTCQIAQKKLLQKTWKVSQ